MTKKQNDERAAAIAKIYSGPMYHTWSAKRRALYEWERRLFDTYCPDRRTSTLVIGSGNGRETFGLYDVGFENIQGIDITPAFVELANKRSRELGININFTVARADSLPLKNDQFGMVTLLANIYGHVTPRASRLAVLKEVRRVLEPGGIAVIEVVSRYYKPSVRVALRLMDILHCFYNPCHLEEGDKLMRKARKLRVAPTELPRSHWFWRHELESEIAESQLDVIHATSLKEFVEMVPGAKLGGNARLLYVVRKPLNPSHAQSVDEQPLP